MADAPLISFQKPAKKREKDFSHRFVKGGPPGPGRPKGSLDKVSRDIRERARALLSEEGYLESLRYRLQQGILAPAVEVTLMHYAYGKPRETVDVHATIRPLIIDAFRPDDASPRDDEE